MAEGSRGKFFAFGRRKSRGKPGHPSLFLPIFARRFLIRCEPECYIPANPRGQATMRIDEIGPVIFGLSQKKKKYKQSENAQRWSAGDKSNLYLRMNTKNFTIFPCSSHRKKMNF